MINFTYQTPNYFETVLMFFSIIKKLESIGVSVRANSEGIQVTAPHDKAYNTELYTYPEELIAFYHGIMDGLDYQKHQESTGKPDIWFKKDMMQK